MSNSGTDSAYLYGNQIVRQDLICKNGYLHELHDVLTPPDNMAGYIRGNADLGSFNHLMDRFCLPAYYGTTTSGDSIYELRYFNNGRRSLTTDNEGKTAPGPLLYDPGWNLYASTTNTSNTQAGYEQTMGCIFAPQDYKTVMGPAAGKELPAILAALQRQLWLYGLQRRLPHAHTPRRAEVGEGDIDELGRRP